MQNIEIKYRLADRNGFEKRLREFKDIEFQYTQQQRDIYFAVDAGRMKIRIQDQHQPHLIRYQRSNQATERISDYEITYLDDFESQLENLAQKHGLLGDVIKKRTLYLYKNVRIHLDQVQRLGDFLEFESVISQDCNPQTAQQNLDVLNHRLRFFLNSPQAVSYIDLIRESLISQRKTHH